MSHLRTLADLLIVAPADRQSLEVTRLAPSVETSDQYLTVLKNGNVSASGVSKSPSISFLKALLEYGECLICLKRNWTNRSGIAGGIFLGTSVNRAQFELIERDAFLFHYRNEVPFAPLKAIHLKVDFPQLLIFEMNSADPRFFSILATDRVSAGQNPIAPHCLIFGTATHLNRSAAIRKAIEEYSALRYNHLVDPEFCGSCKVADRRNSGAYHHGASSDPRNIERFKRLCSLTRPMSSRIPRTDQGEVSRTWKTEKLESPLRFFNFARASNPLLIPLSFGEPEPDSPAEHPLYHPFW